MYRRHMLIEIRQALDLSNVTIVDPVPMFHHLPVAFPCLGIGQRILDLQPLSFVLHLDPLHDVKRVAARDAQPVMDPVMVIDEVDTLRPSDQAYDKKVAGVVSGAGECRPGIILGREQSRNSMMPVALMGKVYCKVDAGYSPIDVGDLLTTSPTPGHAMKADDHDKAFGAVIGKALRRLEAGQGLIPILVALQ